MKKHPLTPQNLRLGSVIFDNEKQKLVIAKAITLIQLEIVGIEKFNFMYSPIPITIPFLESIGFERLEYIGYRENTIRMVAYNVCDGTSNFEIYIDDCIEYWVDSDERQCFIETKYIHNLQNAYYAIVGHDFEVDLSKIKYLQP